MNKDTFIKAWSRELSVSEDDLYDFYNKVIAFEDQLEPEGEDACGRTESERIAWVKGYQACARQSVPPQQPSEGEILDALQTAKETIKVWHGEPAWEFYQHSREMKKINAAIKELLNR